MRGSLAMVRVAKTWAVAHGRTFVLPDDIKELAQPVLGHRVMLTPEAEFAHLTTEQVIARVLSDVAPPSARGEV
jgi:MoxR-like ATPase